MGISVLLCTKKIDPPVPERDGMATDGVDQRGTCWAVPKAAGVGCDVGEGSTSRRACMVGGMGGMALAERSSSGGGNCSFVGEERPDGLASAFVGERCAAAEGSWALEASGGGRGGSKPFSGVSAKGDAALVGDDCTDWPGGTFFGDQRVAEEGGRGSFSKPRGEEGRRVYAGAAPEKAASGVEGRETVKAEGATDKREKEGDDGGEESVEEGGECEWFVSQNSAQWHVTRFQSSAMKYAPPSKPLMVLWASSL
ncbi:hypothetical protein C8J57DRAFT_1250309 [Mycena rebaudengoi]|nr:hypothetical protein C8J57DRAFT_1250309 [Mycena rebaudengoi]